MIDVDAPRSTRRCTTGISYNLYEMPVEELEELLNTKKRRENRVAVSSAPRTQIINRITLTNSIMMLKQVADHPYLALTPCDPNSKTRQLLVNEELITKSGKMMVLDAILPKLKAKGHKVSDTLTCFLYLKTKCTSFFPGFVVQHPLHGPGFN